MAKCTARSWSGDNVRAYCTARAVARSMRSTSTTTMLRRSTGASHASDAPASSWASSWAYWRCRRNSTRTPRGSSTTTTQAPSVNLAAAMMTSTTSDSAAAVPLMTVRASPVGLAVGEVVLHHARPRHGEPGEHADGVERDEAVDVGPGDEQEGDGDHGEDHDPGGEHEAVPPPGELAGQVGVLRREAGQEGEAGEAGVGRQHQDEHGPVLEGQVQDVGEGAGAVHVPGHLGHHRRGPLEVGHGVDDGGQGGHARARASPG